jgi:hypothetical protein
MPIENERLNVKEMIVSKQGETRERERHNPLFPN